MVPKMAQLKYVYSRVMGEKMDLFTPKTMSVIKTKPGRNVSQYFKIDHFRHPTNMTFTHCCHMKKDECDRYATDFLMKKTF